MMKLIRKPTKMRLDRIAIGVLLLAAAGVGMHGWLLENPQHNPWAPLELEHPLGWATGTKLDGLRNDIQACRNVLERGNVSFRTLQETGEGACLRSDRNVLLDRQLSPADAQMTCLAATGYVLWLRHVVIPATESLGTSLRRIEHLGTYNCRRIGGGADGRWSEHATGNALDIAAFVLEDGRRISVQDDWNGGGEEAEFLRQVRDGSCGLFATVLSPDYNAAHADHLHLDQAERVIGSVCR